MKRRPCSKKSEKLRVYLEGDCPPLTPNSLKGLSRDMKRSAKARSIFERDNCLVENELEAGQN